MSDPIQTVIFDLGRVLIDFDWDRALDKICAQSPLPREEIVRMVKNDGRVIDYETGKISTEDFFRAQKNAFQFKGSWQDLNAAWCDIFTPIESNIALARQLARRCRLGVLSNTNEAHIGWFESKYDFLSIFPARIYSCRIGYMKPRCEIYEAAAAALPLVPAQTVFIDDIAANVEAASALGWKAVHLQPGTDLPAALEQCGLSALAGI